MQCAARSQDLFAVVQERNPDANKVVIAHVQKIAAVQVMVFK